MAERTSRTGVLHREAQIVALANSACYKTACFCGVTLDPLVTTFLRDNFKTVKGYELGRARATRKCSSLGRVD